jgi:hypothetical protein
MTSAQGDTDVPTAVSAVARSTRADAAIFLDVDGVLHSLAADAPQFKRACMRRLREIVHSSGAQIVLSSAWRCSAAGRAAVDEQLVSAGLAPAVSHTAESGFAERADEIVDWLARHPLVQHWVVIDDMQLDDDEAGHSTALPSANCVQTDSYAGLTDADVQQAAAALRRRCDRSTLPTPHTREEMRF